MKSLECHFQVTFKPLKSDLLGSPLLDPHLGNGEKQHYATPNSHSNFEGWDGKPSNFSARRLCRVSSYFASRAQRNECPVLWRCALPTKRHYQGVRKFRLVEKLFSTCFPLAFLPVEKQTPLVMPSVYLYALYTCDSARWHPEKSHATLLLSFHLTVCSGFQCKNWKSWKLHLILEKYVERKPIQLNERIV